ncbi:hypothetical protein QJS83_12665 [Bdellovibrio sp. 22V]|uniref:hypothetical protein n=1 Tax=Bdellovibrio sp. 22V TaxID=3044166 RepID=UPI0025431249|nr:hypothetical protein [Bdellovibrio sp. 22V]WII71315.1 hypothetical protein QJS83_12665 [Bdellovibrio sp. 22V]
MKQYLSVLTLAAALLSVVPSFAEYDPFDCTTNSNLEASGLQCVSCGITKYYADRGEVVDPSHKWLVLLSLMVRKEGSSNDKQKMQMAVIKAIQSYGFCNQYLGEETLKNGRSKASHDMSAKDWEYFFKFLTTEALPAEKSYNDAAKKLGFKNAWMSNTAARKNMDYLFEGMFDGIFLDAKRDKFASKLNELDDFSNDGKDDQGLRSCLREIREKFFTKRMTDRETYKMCEVVADACDIPRVPMAKGQDFCVHNGMGLRPASVKQPNPISPIAPPPSPGSSGSRKGTR